jgi:hypothetical protein
MEDWLRRKFDPRILYLSPEATVVLVSVFGILNCKKLAKFMEEKSKQNKKSIVFDSTRRKAIQKLYADAGIEMVDKTEESIGKTSLLFLNSPKSVESDEAETYLRNLNRRK